MNQVLLNRIRQCPALPTLPAIAIQVLEMAQSEDVDIAEIARVISRDPAISSKILRTVNSSFYGRSQSVSQVSQALVILGLQSVKSLVLGFSLVGNLKQSKPSGFSHLEYWKRSIYAATAAKVIAASVDIVQAEECFLVGLLQDIGMLVLDQVLKEEYGVVCARARTHKDLVEAERASLQSTHAEVSGMLAEMWKLPPLLALPMRYHHDPGAIDEDGLRELVNVAHAAGLCAEVFVQGDPTQPIADARAYFKQAFNLSEAACDALMGNIGQQTREAAPLFDIKLGEALDFDEILKRANEALVDLTLRSQQQAMKLEAQNSKLKEVATTDQLTGLANRVRFDSFLNEQFDAAAKSGRPLSLLLLDLDKFKAVNDEHGHQIGDEVLRAIGKFLRTAARASDLAARYGGEEMVLVLPQTTKQTAAAIAESIRRAVAAKPIPCDSVSVPVTLSIGVATFEPPASPLKQAGHLVKAADMAVYAAKNAGRNCVKVFTLPGASKAPAA
jgi:two-component system, cell cycle response regulator